MSGEEAVAYGLIDTVLERRGATDVLPARGA
jgi:ATP-dependent protease ClpP protease subunit